MFHTVSNREYDNISCPKHKCCTRSLLHVLDTHENQVNSVLAALTSYLTEMLRKHKCCSHICVLPPKNCSRHRPWTVHSLFISPRTARVWVDPGLSVNVPQMTAFVLQVGFVRVNLTEAGAVAHSSLPINAAALFQLASVSDTSVFPSHRSCTPSYPPSQLSPVNHRLPVVS